MRLAVGEPLYDVGRPRDPAPRGARRGSTMNLDRPERAAQVPQQRLRLTFLPAS
jgi:hypothetical protein